MAQRLRNVELTRGRVSCPKNNAAPPPTPAVPCFKLPRRSQKSSCGAVISLAENEHEKEDVKVMSQKNPDGTVTTTTTTVRVTKSLKNGTTAGGRTAPVKLSDIIGDKKPSPPGLKKPSAEIQNCGNKSPEKPKSAWAGAGKPLPGKKRCIVPLSRDLSADGENLTETAKGEGKKLFGGALGKHSKFKEIGKDGGVKRKIPDDVQDFERIRSELSGTGKLFEDPEFPAADSSIFYSESGRVDCIWKRPKELVDNPQFFVGGASRFDVNQGELGNCWFLAAVANLTMNDHLFYQVVPKDNSFDKDYCGLFHFRFWQYGRWIDVVVDDRLPCNRQGQLVYMHSTEKTEFWSALLEKAYAKLAGSYEGLIGGQASEALQDFSGGLVEMFELKETKLDVFNLMEKAIRQQSFMSCSLKANPNVKEAQLNVGLVRGHAYSVTSVHRIDIKTPNKTGKIPLCRIRNPWGNSFEWKGAWSDGSREWDLVSDKVKKEIGLSFDDDGEFWMSFKDFMTHFDCLEVVNLSPDSMLPGMELDGKSWNTSHFEGTWTTGCTAGGCSNFISKHPNTYPMNPQYIVEFDGPDAEGDPNKATVLVALMQKSRRSKKKEGVSALSIGFAIYALTDPMEKIPNPLDLNYFTYHKRNLDSGMFVNLREVSGRFELVPGIKYCIIPTSFMPHEEGEFLIRVFSEAKNRMTENGGDLGLGEIDEKVEASAKEENKETTEVIKNLFAEVAGDEEEIGWAKLKKLLDSYLRKEFQFEGFSREVCRSMVAMVDLDRSGKMGLDEFTELWTSILRWKSVFKTFDEDGSGTLSLFELRKALTAAGYLVNNQVLKALVLRYGDEDESISFEDFIMCSVKLKAMIDAFKEKDTTGKNEANFTLSEWVGLTVYA